MLSILAQSSKDKLYRLNHNKKEIIKNHGIKFIIPNKLEIRSIATCNNNSKNIQLLAELNLKVERLIFHLNRRRFVLKMI